MSAQETAVTTEPRQGMVRAHQRHLRLSIQSAEPHSESTMIIAKIETFSLRIPFNPVTRTAATAGAGQRPGRRGFAARKQLDDPFRLRPRNAPDSGTQER
jgi:hypothetical protein